MPAIKVCGICNLEDAEKSVELGADYLGFIFASSARQIEPADARNIRRKLKGRVKFVGVFKDQDLRMINDTAEVIGLDFVQLHGEETPEYCSQIKLPVIKTVEIYPGAQISTPTADDVSAVAAAESVSSVSELASPEPITSDELVAILPNLSAYSVHAILFDRPKSLAADEHWLKQVVERYGEQMQRFQPFFIAGGLNAGNVQIACLLNPFGIDIASGVEAEPGKKDHTKLEAFFQSVQGATTC